MDYKRLTHTLGPCINKDSRVLILGSFPSVKSREQNFYYANPTNRFFPVLEQLFGEACGSTIEEKKQFLKKHKIALFDVIKECSIKGSSDSSIKDVIANDIQALVDESDIQVVFTTGSTSSKLYEKYITCNKPHISLPSTSSANARMKLDDLTNAYKIVLEYID